MYTRNPPIDREYCNFARDLYNGSAAAMSHETYVRDDDNKPARSFRWRSARPITGNTIRTTSNYILAETWRA